jgi:serine/threonine-protein kinase
VAGGSTNPKKLGKYEITAELGRGAMGIVYKAHDPSIGRLVALKTITSGLAGDPELFARFCQEARSAGALEHPNIVTIYELSPEGDTPYIAMAYLEGESLEKFIARRPLMPVSQKLGYMVQVCRALDYAHRHGVVHRDIKPGNVVVTTEGVIKVVDFGIAHLVDASKTQTGMVIGTFAYMSPQQLQGERADERFDIWAAGVMFYELLAYDRPFRGETQAALITSILTKEPQPLPEVVPDCPAEVDDLIRKMLRKPPSERFQTFEELLVQLEPLWRRMAQETVANLVADSRHLFDSRDYQKARELLRSALQIDSQAIHAKTLLDRVNAEIKRTQLLPQLKERVVKAQNLLQTGQLREAKIEAEAALQLDSTFQPARDLLVKLEQAYKRQEQVQQMLNLSNQRLAEGALTEAGLQVEKALELDGSNPQAQELRRRIQEEAARRQKRRKLLEVLHNARTLWAELRYDECIALLTAEQAEFPGESEIIKLLEIARQDQAEQRKQLQLKEARNLLASQRFNEALAVLDALLQTHPSDPTALSLRTLVLHEREAQAKQQRFQSELATLRASITRGNYDEALRKGEELRQEFPQELELTELVDFARSQAAQIARKRSLEEKLKTLEQQIAAAQFEQALTYAEKSLLEFPGNADIIGLRDRAQQLHKEKERHELLEKRIREIKAKVRREELTDAIDLAQQTLFTAGPDTDVQQLLNAAKKEYDEREKKRSEQDRQLQAAQTSLQSGDVDGATRILDQGLATRLFTPADERVHRMLTQIQTTRGSRGRQPAPGPLAPSPETPSRAPVFQPVGPQMGTPVAQDGAVAQDATVLASAGAVGPAVAPVPPPAVPELPAEAPGGPEWSATRLGLPTQYPAPAEIPRAPTPEPRGPVPTVPARVSKKLVIVGVAVVLAIALSVVLYIVTRPVVVGVHFEAAPSGTDVSVNGEHCQAPCDLKLKPGNYIVQAAHEAYEPLQQQITVGTHPEPISLKLIPARPSVGTLVVETNVDQVDVLVDGALKGVTAGGRTTITLLPGSHQVRVEKSGFEPSAQQAEISKDVEARLRFTLSKAEGTAPPPARDPYLIVRARAGARVQVDKTAVGEVQADGTYSVQVKPGKHSVELTLSGYQPWAKTITAKPGESLTIPADLKEVAKPKPAIATFSASATNVQPGQPANLQWQTQNATEVFIDQGIGPVQASGSRQVTPSTSTTYTLTARGEGQAAKSSVTISVAALAKPSISTFESGSDRIQQGQSTKLIWATQNATDISITELGSVQSSGSRVVSPTKTTDYVLTAKGTGGTVTKSVQVIVEAVAPPSLPRPSSEPAKAAIDRYRDAWQSMSIDEMRKAWPSIPKNKEKDIKTVFNQFKAIRVTLACSEPSIIPSINGNDRVQCACSQDFTYTGRDGRVQPPVHGSTVFQLKKVGGTWYVDDVR